MTLKDTFRFTHRSRNDVSTSTMSLTNHTEAPVGYKPPFAISWPSKLPFKAKCNLEPPKVFNLLHCFCVSLGSVVTSSILLNFPNIHAKAGGLTPAILIWFCCGAMNFVGAQCYAEMSVAIGKSGGEFIMLYQSLPNPMPSFMQVWATLVAGSTLMSVTLSLMFSEYATQLLFWSYGAQVPQSGLRLVAAVQLMLVFALHCISTQWVARFQTALTAFKIGFLCLIIGAAFRIVLSGQGNDVMSELRHFADVDAHSVCEAFFYASPVFLGWQNIASVAGEIKNVKRSLPWSVSITAIFAPFVAILLHLSFTAVLTEQELQSSTPAIILFSYKALGSFAPISFMLVMVQALSSVNTGLLAGTRIMYASARESMAPEFWAMLHIKRLAFIPPTITLLVIALPMIFITNLNELLLIFSAFQWIPPSFVALALPIHRWKYKDIERPYQVPIFFPFIFLSYGLFLTIITIIKFPSSVVLCFGIIAPAFPIFIFCVKLQRPKRLFKFIGYITVFLQKLFLVAHDLDGK